MDLTLKQIIEKVDDIHFQVNKLDIVINFIKIKAYLSELKNLEKQIGSVYMKVANISQICCNKNNSCTDTKNETYSDNDWTYLNRSITPYSLSKNIANNIDINVTIVKNINEIPNTPLYWVSEINQFAFHINGVILRGNIGNIYNQTHIKSNVSTNQTIICRHHNDCKNLQMNKLCKFYHDPNELLNALDKKIITKETFIKYKSLSRNFINTSWLYTDLPHTKKNIMMRHFGSKNTLKHEFDLMKISNSKINEILIDNYRQQTIHDLLVIMGLNQCGLLKEYPDLDMNIGYYDNNNTFSVLGNE
jgi:hypothetical protein